jgi:hypothetical protein
MSNTASVHGDLAKKLSTCLRAPEKKCPGSTQDCAIVRLKS